MKPKIFLKLLSCVFIFVIGFMGTNPIDRENTKVVKAETEDIYEVTASSSDCMPKRSQEEIIEDADVIVVGKVKEILESRWSNENYIKGEEVPNILQKDIIVEVDELYRGNLQNKKDVVVRIEAENEGFYPSGGYINFSKDEEVLLFLSEDDSILNDGSENYYVLAGGSQGLYRSDGEVCFLSKNDLGEAIYLDKSDLKIETEKQSVETIDYVVFKLGPNNVNKMGLLQN